ncbi:type 4 pilin [[Leptolyngbya] sp. PCC 7376]|uniref:type II secretion system protein n=1 Tax=[Leptolyngbya] sp. PCC 7376 TaxID=111781 RepID=UPI00029F27F3|nr:type II secretion system protein [[Leptolyngbya] sp. PCC 7376]AFY39117.1 type 4 pilin [[Leptolyngbya] sp. PCC 7376]
MLPFHVTKHQSPQKTQYYQTGFTLIEVLVVVFLIAIMSAIVGPGMLGFLQRTKISSAQSEVLGILQEAQRTAVRGTTNCNDTSCVTTCSLTLPASNSLASAATNNVLVVSSSCAASGDRSLEGVRIRHNFASVNSTYDGTTTLIADLFNFKGTTSDSLTQNDSEGKKDLVIVFTSESSEAFQKCLVVSSGLGLIRVGNYAPGSADAVQSKCSAINS